MPHSPPASKDGTDAHEGEEGAGGFGDDMHLEPAPLNITLFPYAIRLFAECPRFQPKL